MAEKTRESLDRQVSNILPKVADFYKELTGKDIVELPKVVVDNAVILKSARESGSARPPLALTDVSNGVVYLSGIEAATPEVLAHEFVHSMQLKEKFESKIAKIAPSFNFMLMELAPVLFGKLFSLSQNGTECSRAGLCRYIMLGDGALNLGQSARALALLDHLYSETDDIESHRDFTAKLVGIMDRMLERPDSAPQLVGHAIARLSLAILILKGNDPDKMMRDLLNSDEEDTFWYLLERMGRNCGDGLLESSGICRIMGYDTLEEPLCIAKAEGYGEISELALSNWGDTPEMQNAKRMIITTLDYLGGSGEFVLGRQLLRMEQYDKDYARVWDAAVVSLLNEGIISAKLEQVPIGLTKAGKIIAERLRKVFEIYPENGT